ncbi:MAG: hypothetical protein ACLPX9_07940 [Rhodomicrobium sp.]
MAPIAAPPAMPPVAALPGVPRLEMGGAVGMGTAAAGVSMGEVHGMGMAATTMMAAATAVMVAASNKGQRTAPSRCS